MEDLTQSETKNKRRHRLRIIIPSFPAFNIYSNIARLTTALGPVCIASVVNKMPGWEVEIIDENNYRCHGPLDDKKQPDHQLLQEWRPADVVGFYGGLTSTVPRLYALAALYKKMGVTTIAGGQHFVGENITEGLDNNIDVILAEEAEETIMECLPALVAGADKSRIAGLIYKENGQLVRTAKRTPILDFDRFPIPDFSLVRYAKIKLFPVGRVRGCGMNCEFCTVKGKARYATPERLMEQIMSAAERWHADTFFIVDDLFGQDREDTLRFCRLVKNYQEKIRKSFDITIQIRLDKSNDTELLQAMRSARITMLAIGFESPIQEELQSMNKHLKPEDMIQMTRQFHKAGFLIHGMFIFGYPMAEGVDFQMSAQERVRQFRQFIKKSRIDTVQVLLPVPAPGTELTQRLKAQNRIYPLKYLGWEYYDGNFPLFKPDNPLTPETMQASLKKIMGRFYRFKYMFATGIYVLSFPMLIFYLHNLREGWQKWHRTWRNNLLRFGGWIIIRRWNKQLKKGTFSQRLAQAKQSIAAHN